ALQGCPRNLRTGAVASVHKSMPSQTVERAFVDFAPLALPYQWLIGDEPDPRQIVEDFDIVFAPAAMPIVVLDPQQDPPAARPCLTPHVDRIDDVTEVEEAGWCRREPGYHVAHYAKTASRSPRLRVSVDDRRPARAAAGEAEGRRVAHLRWRSGEHAVLAA